MAPVAEPREPAEPRGTQSIERALRILRELAARGQFGSRLSDLATHCEMDKGTAHRVLTCLVRERFVAQRAIDRHYFPGPMLYELGLSLPNYAAFARTCEGRLKRVAQEMKAITWLALRSGDDFVCAARQGTLELRGLMVHVGTRRPLFTSVGGIAILHTLPDDEARRALDENMRQEVARRGDSRLAALAGMRERAQRQGFASHLGDLAPGVHAFGVPVRGDDGRALASVCVSGDALQFDASRFDEVHAKLLLLAASVADDAREHLGSVMHIGDVAAPRWPP